jgi:chemotaxis methyl-accepting protein methylase
MRSQRRVAAGYFDCSSIRREQVALRRELLIRDQLFRVRAFDVVAEHAVRRSSPAFGRASVRVWVTGASTGEEASSACSSSGVRSRAAWP